MVIVRGAGPKAFCAGGDVVGRLVLLKNNVTKLVTDRPEFRWRIGARARKWVDKFFELHIIQHLVNSHTLLICICFLTHIGYWYF